MSETELQKATGDIYYEAEMLYTAHMNYWKHESPSRQGQPQWLHNFIIEATLIHTRALLDFFEGSRTAATGRAPHNDDVLAEDYNFASARFPLSSDLRKRINTSIAHLSYGRTRIADDKRHWDFVGFIPLILLRSANFFRHLLDSEHPPLVLSRGPGNRTIHRQCQSPKHLTDRASEPLLRLSEGEVPYESTISPVYLFFCSFVVAAAVLCPSSLSL